MMKGRWFLIAILASCLLFQGCRSAPTPTDTPPTEAPGLPQTTLTFRFPRLTDGEKPDSALVLSEIERKSAESLDIRLDFAWLPPSLYAESILETISSGADLDAFYCGLPGQGPLDFPAMARDGLLADLTDDLPRHAPGLNSRYDRNDLACATVDGRLVALPSLFPMADHVYAIVRQDYVERYGLQAIRTFDDYGGYLEVVRRNEPDIIPGKIADGTVAIFARASGYAVFDKALGLVYEWGDETVRILPWERTPAFRKAAAYLSTWAENDFLSLDPKGIGNIWEAGEMIIDGRIASFLFAGEYRIGETIGIVESVLDDYLKINGIPGEIAAYRMYPELQAQRLNPMGDGFVTGSLAIPAKSAHVDRTLMFLEWLHGSQENYDLLLYGIEGRHHRLVGEQLGLPDGVALDQNGYLGWDGRSAFKDLAYERFFVGQPVDARDAYAEDIRDNAVLAPHEGFYADWARMGQTVEQRRQMLVASLELPLLTGTLASDDIDRVIEELGMAGTDGIVAELQTQLDSHLGG